MITEEEKPDGGSIKIVRPSRWPMPINCARWMRENRLEEISGGEDTITLGVRKLNSRAYVASFNFLGTDQQKQIKVLSGGERNACI